ncbi:MAG: ORF6C domain-containing protein, partial [Clostridium sp.]|uniref:Rha family transcriptional regulator n=1 Tax=Clostridium sp. TaxID=1506 RepID=UPI0025BDEB19
VLEKIEELIKTEKSVMTMFIESSYKAGTGKEYKEYLITRDGFSLLVMGFTGTKALAWKLKYIEAFNKMEISLKVQVKELSAKEMLKLQFTYTEELDSRLTNLENRMTIETGNQKVLCDLVNKKVLAVLGGKDSPAYKELSKKAFRQCWKDYKRIVGVASYKDTAIKDFDFARKVIVDWKPNRDLELMIAGCNAQLRM